MKKLLLCSMIVAVAAVSQAKEPMEYLTGKVAKADVIDGCGLGWQVTDSRTFIGTTTRGTTNMTVPATFGMTSGTLGCEKIQFAKNDEKAATFVSTNFQTLKAELAEGQGEYVAGMIQSFGCSSEQVQAISNKIQGNYKSVVAPAQNAQQLFLNLKKEIGFCG